MPSGSPGRFLRRSRPLKVKQSIAAEGYTTNCDFLTQHTLGKYPIVSHGALLLGPIRHPEVVVAEQRFVAEQVGENVGNVQPGTLRLAVA